MCRTGHEMHSVQTTWFLTCVQNTIAPVRVACWLLVLYYIPEFDTEISQFLDFRSNVSKCFLLLLLLFPFYGYRGLEYLIWMFSSCYLQIICRNRTHGSSRPPNFQKKKILCNVNYFHEKYWIQITPFLHLRNKRYWQLSDCVSIEWLKSFIFVAFICTVNWGPIIIFTYSFIITLLSFVSLKTSC